MEAHLSETKWSEGAESSQLNLQEADQHLMNNPTPVRVATTATAPRTWESSNTPGQKLIHSNPREPFRNARAACRELGSLSLCGITNNSHLST